MRLLTTGVRPDFTLTARLCVYYTILTRFCEMGQLWGFRAVVATSVANLGRGCGGTETDSAIPQGCHRIGQRKAEWSRTPAHSGLVVSLLYSEGGGWAFQLIPLPLIWTSARADPSHRRPNPWPLGLVRRWLRMCAGARR